MAVISEREYAGPRAAVDRGVTAQDVALWLHHRRLALRPVTRPFWPCCGRMREMS